MDSFDETVRLTYGVIHQRVVVTGIEDRGTIFAASYGHTKTETWFLRLHELPAGNDDRAKPMSNSRESVEGAATPSHHTSVDMEEVRARLAAIVESSDDAIISKTLDGVIRTWNTAAERLFGYSAAEAIGQPITMIIPPERLDEERSILDRIRRGERVDHFETLRRAKDGRLVDISLTVSPIRDGSGTIIGASKVARDITERKRAENALRESEERYRLAAIEAAEAAAANAKFRAFFEQGSNFAGVLALDGTVMEANRLCLVACGFTRDEVIGKPFWECGWWNRSPELKEMVRNGVLQAAAGQQFRTESHYFIAGGQQRIVDLILAPVTNQAGRVLFVAATGTDITDRRLMEDALRENDRKKDEFIALLAHELRNPLAPLRNGLHLVKLAGGDADVIDQVRAMMDRQLGHMVRLVDDLLDVARLGQNKMKLRRSRVLLGDVVSSAVETARPMIDQAGHQLSVLLPAEPLFLDADLTRLAQVFSNLLTNSAKYTERGGRIGLHAKRHGSEVVVSVRDNGIGIPTAAVPRLFDMFSQVERSDEHTTSGLGIGLALVKGLVEMHGGTVSVESRGPGLGSEFSVRLPLAAGVSEPVPDGRLEPAASGSDQRVLVVDDDEDSVESMARVLGLMSNAVRTARDGIEAVQVAEEFRPDVVLMDLGMPRLDGYEAARRIREFAWGQFIAIVALTGWGQDADRAKSRDAGFDGHLVKPVSFIDLESILAESKRKRNRNQPTKHINPGR